LCSQLLEFTNLQKKLKHLKMEEFSSLREINKSQKLEMEAMKSKLKEVEAKYNHLVDKLKDRIECPICLEVPISGPIPVCTNGHLVCNNCKTGSCPTCRVPMGNNRSLLAIAVIENIEHECKFAACEEVFPVDKLGEHAKICKHRTVACPQDLCNIEFDLSKLLDHVQNGCSYNGVPTVIGDSENVSEIYYGPDQVGDWSWEMNIVSCQNVIFAVFPQKTDNYYFFSIVMFESETECSKFNIEMVVENEGGSTSPDTEVCFKFCGNPISIDVAKNDQKYFGLTVSNSGMDKILERSEAKGFQFSFKIQKNG